MDDRFLPPGEAARFLGDLNTRTLIRWAREGYIPTIPIGEGRRRLWRFLESDLETWMLARRTGQVPAEIQAREDTLFAATDAPQGDSLRDSNRFQNGSLTLVKNMKADDSWFFRYHEDVDGRRVHRNLRIGTVRDFPRRRDAERAVLSLRSTINSGVRSPETVGDLVAHYPLSEFLDGLI